MNVSKDILDQHCDQRSERERMEVRRVTKNDISEDSRRQSIHPTTYQPSKNVLPDESTQFLMPGEGSNRPTESR
jgi:hypothetical protein